MMRYLFLITSLCMIDCFIHGNVLPDNYLLMSNADLASWKKAHEYPVAAASKTASVKYEWLKKETDFFTQLVERVKKDVTQAEPNADAKVARFKSLVEFLKTQTAPIKPTPVLQKTLTAFDMVGLERSLQANKKAKQAALQAVIDAELHKIAENIELIIDVHTEDALHFDAEALAHFASDLVMLQHYIDEYKTKIAGSKPLQTKLDGYIHTMSLLKKKLDDAHSFMQQRELIIHQIGTLLQTKPFGQSSFDSITQQAHNFTDMLNKAATAGMNIQGQRELLTKLQAKAQALLTAKRAEDAQKAAHAAKQAAAKKAFTDEIAHLKLMHLTTEDMVSGFMDKVIDIYERYNSYKKEYQVKNDTDIDKGLEQLHTMQEQAELAIKTKQMEAEKKAAHAQELAIRTALEQRITHLRQTLAASDEKALSSFSQNIIDLKRDSAVAKLTAALAPEIAELEGAYKQAIQKVQEIQAHKKMELAKQKAQELQRRLDDAWQAVTRFELPDARVLLTSQELEKLSPTTPEKFNDFKQAIAHFAAVLKEAESVCKEGHNEFCI